MRETPSTGRAGGVTSGEGLPRPLSSQALRAVLLAYATFQLRPGVADTFIKLSIKSEAEINSRILLVRFVLLGSGNYLQAGSGLV